MDTNSEYPKIRFVEAFPIKTEHGKMICLRDPAGIATEMIILSPDIFYLLQFFDGRHSQLDLRHEYNRAFGTLLYEEQLAEVLNNLDAHLFLEGASYTKKVKSLETELLKHPVRPAAHAGHSYESDPVKLNAQINGFFQDPKGAGLKKTNSKKRRVKALVAPHIDLRAGGPCYTHAYKVLETADDIDCFVIIGTGHSGLKNLYSILAKDHEIPFGKVKCDTEFIDAFNANYGSNHYEVLPHKNEHVIEFQLVFLQYLLRKKRPFTIVPILSSFSYEMLNGANFDREKQIVGRFSAALKKTIREYHKKVCLIASVDFSHVGPYYGDQLSPDSQFLAKVKKADKDLFRNIQNLNADGFLNSIASNQDDYRVCGFSSIYTLLKTVDAKECKLLDYSNAKMDKQNSTVTFASMVFH